MTYSEKKLFDIVEKMPAFPHSTYHILKLTTDINCSPKELVQIIELDPILTLHLLKLVNSDFFGLSKKISSIKQSVVFLGVNTMKNLVLSIAPIEMLSGKQAQSGLLDPLLLHLIATAIIARRLARHLGVSEIDATGYFVSGLLHDFGKVALAKIMPEKYGNVLKIAAQNTIPLHQVEQQELEVDHCIVGAVLGKKWQLPLEFIRSMSEHHDLPGEEPSQVLDCVRTANQIAKMLAYGDSGNPVVDLVLPVSITQRFGMGLNELSATLSIVADELARARVLITNLD